MMAFADNATYYSATPKGDAKDRLDVEIGDSKQTEFQPQAKFMRWDNEVNCSVRLVNNEVAPVVEQKTDSIEWRGARMECHFLHDPAASEDGGFEVDVILNQPPPSNVLQFTMQTKGLEFFYQPPLDAQEIKDGCVRPERVVGSYAVFYKNCPANMVGGKLYRTGKAFHIYRPRIKDSAGKEVWGELSIDAGILSVTIPQDFIDAAVYPIRQAAGLSFGYTSVGATGTNAGAAKVCIKSVDTPASTGTLDSMSFYCSTSAAARFETALYTDSSNVPSARLAYIESGGTSASGTPAWVTTVPTSGMPCTITSGVQYWIGASSTRNTDTGVLDCVYDTGASGCWNSSASQFWDDPWVSNANLTRQFSLYATYTASGGTTRPVKMAGEWGGYAGTSGGFAG